MKKKVDIEKLLKWAFCDELPKAVPDGYGAGGGGRSAWQSIESYVQLLTRVDDNRYGVLPTMSPLDDDPHPDAMKVYGAVRDLDGQVLDFPADWNPMPEIAAHEIECSLALKSAMFGISNASSSPSEIVQYHAIMGGCPDWHGEIPKLVTVKNRNGQEAWFRTVVQQGVDAWGNAAEYTHELEDGWCYVRKAPKRGAYRKFAFDPDPVPCLIGRGQYQIWFSNLTILVEKLRGRLEIWELSDLTRTPCPWEADSRAEPRILMAL